MPSLNIRDQRQTPRPDLTIFYVLDRSGSMSGYRDQMLDTAMENTVSELKRLRSCDSHLRIAVLEYDSSVRWLSDEPTYIEDFAWRGIAQSRASRLPGELSAPAGLTNIPAALIELNEKMSEHAYLGLRCGAYMPIVIFMTDGFINDAFLPKLAPALDALTHNLWFQRATKIGFAIGDDADRDVVRRIVGTGGLIETTDLDDFAEKLAQVSVSASMIGGSSRLTKRRTAPDATSSQEGEAWPDPQTMRQGAFWDDNAWGWQGAWPASQETVGVDKAQGQSNATWTDGGW